MKAATIQQSSYKGDIERNIEKHLVWIQKAIDHKVDLVAFPELSLTGYEPELASELATNDSDERLQPFQHLSNRHDITICVGIPTRSNGQLHVSMMIFRPNMNITTYSKQHLYPTEISIFAAAHNPLVLPIKEELVAPAICYELSNKEHHEHAAQKGASIYLASVLNSVAGVDEDLQKLSAIASRHRLITMMANYIGTSGGYQCAGKSSIWGDDGMLLAQANGTDEVMLTIDTITKQVEMIR